MRLFKLWALGAGAVLLLLALMGFVIEPSPAAMNPAAPRSTCADLQRAVQQPRNAAGDLLVLRAANLGFECVGEHMNGRLHCDGAVFEATSLPVCLPGRIERVAPISELKVWPVAGGRVAVGTICQGCAFDGRKYHSPEEVARMRFAAPFALVAGLALLGGLAWVWLRTPPQKESAPGGS
jgi:hypothetical protein